MPSKVEERNERIRILRVTQVSDGMGGYEETLATYREVWAKVTPKKGAENSAQGQIRPSYVYVVSVNNDPDMRGILETDRVLWPIADGDTYNVRSVARAGSQPLYLDFEMERGVGQ